MTVEEHVYFFGKIKGIPPHMLEELCEKVIIDMNLIDHRFKCAG
jgi:ABC-type multidrug transport system ATPase subunit